MKQYLSASLCKSLYGYLSTQEASINHLQTLIPDQPDRETAALVVAVPLKVSVVVIEVTGNSSRRIVLRRAPPVTAGANSEGISIGAAGTSRKGHKVAPV